MALAMKPACETCAAPLGLEADAFICSYECTFCSACAERGARRCPNCQGELVRRPRRAAQRDQNA
jgi:hypothetical protein